MRTKSGLPKGCVWNLDRENGKRHVRYRDRKTGFSVYLYGEPWSEAFMRAYAAAREGGQARVEIVGDKRTVAGTINALIVSYYAAIEDLRPSTLRSRRSLLERFRAEFGDLQVKGLTRAHIDTIVKKRTKTPHAANNLVKVLRHMLDHAISQGIIVHNPAIGVKKYPSKSDGWHTWTEAEIAQFLARHPIDTPAWRWRCCSTPASGAATSCGWAGSTSPPI